MMFAAIYGGAIIYKICFLVVVEDTYSDALITSRQPMTTFVVAEEAACDERRIC
jgi:hypothetical protein